MKKYISHCLRLRLMVVCAMLCSSVYGQVSNHKAYALFLYNFTKYVQWPDEAIKDDFRIGVYGKSPVKEELEKLLPTKKAGDRNIRIIELDPARAVSEIHMLFIPDEHSGQIPTLTAALKGKPVLVIAQREGMIQKGAAISFMADHNNLKFELSTGTLTGQNLKVSKTLEALAFRGPS